MNIPHEKNMTTADRELWLKLVRAIKAIYMFGWKRRYTVVDDTSWFGNVTLIKQGLSEDLQTSMGLGSMWAAVHGFPSFLESELETYVGRLDELFNYKKYDYKLFPETALGLLEDNGHKVDWEKVAWQLPHLRVDDLGPMYFFTGLKPAIKTSVGRYAVRQLGYEGKTDELTQGHNLISGDYSKFLKFIENDDLDGWERVYRSPKIKSCMNNYKYGVTRFETYKCYCTSAHGLPDNGLRLAYIEDKDIPVARCIVHEPSKTFVQVYGDDRLLTYLTSAGYKVELSWHEGLTLYTEHFYGWIHPYIDGRLINADLCYEGDTGALVLKECGEWELDATQGLLDSEIEFEDCPICGHAEILNVPAVVDGQRTHVCEGCATRLVSAYFMGEEVECFEDRVVSVYSSPNIYELYEKSLNNLEDSGIVWSNYHALYMIGDYVWSDCAGSYLFSEEAVYLEYKDDYAHDDAVVEISGESVYTDDAEVWTDPNGGDHWIPLKGLSDELDEIRFDIIQEYSGEED